jgi:hypothetical protein
MLFALERCGLGWPLFHLPESRLGIEDVRENERNSDARRVEDGQNVERYEFYHIDRRGHLANEENKRERGRA